MHIIDRRYNPKGKSLPNRQRFIRRARAHLKEAVRQSVRHRQVGDESGEQVTIPDHSVQEPSFHHDPKRGKHDRVLPGNKEYQEGDLIDRPQQGGGGRGRKASQEGEGEDSFQFTLTREEFLELFFEDLELPHLVKTQLKEATAHRPHRAGFSVEGSPTNLAVSRTMRNSLARRIALKRPRKEELAEKEKRLFQLEKKQRSGEEEDELARLRREIADLKQRMKAIPYIDPVDVRYRRFEQIPQPTAQAVMFCLMDVSGSMDERAKDLAKRFFMLLHMFLVRRYEHVEIVFIRHTHRADEVDEETFFYSRETGGTIVSSALEQMLEIVQDRYPTSDWNIYAAQASDGDNIEPDCPRCVELLRTALLPLVQYYAYIEIADAREASLLNNPQVGGPLWQAYRTIATDATWAERFAMRRIFETGDIFPVFRELFARDGYGEARDAA